MTNSAPIFDQNDNKTFALILTRGTTKRPPRHAHNVWLDLAKVHKTIGTKDDLIKRIGWPAQLSDSKDPDNLISEPENSISISNEFYIDSKG